LFSFLITNLLGAIFFAILVTDIFRPGHFVHLPVPALPLTSQKLDLVSVLTSAFPTNFVDPFRDNNILCVIAVAITIGIALRVLRLRNEVSELQSGFVIGQILDTAFQTIMVVFEWIFEVVPIGVFAVVAVLVGSSGLAPIILLGPFVGAVVFAMALQVGFYLVRLRFQSKISPARFLSGGRDAFILAFMTASSVATLPVTYASVKERIGVREESAALGVMIGGTFNHDGAALYEAMAALFVAQAIGFHLTFLQQGLIVLMAMLSSIGAAGIPGAGLVTLFAVFSVLRLPTEYVALLLPLDWFLDRCRTTINVMGDMTVTCLLDNGDCMVEIQMPDDSCQPELLSLGK